MASHCKVRVWMQQAHLDLFKRVLIRAVCLLADAVFEQLPAHRHARDVEHVQEAARVALHAQALEPVRADCLHEQTIMSACASTGREMAELASSLHTYYAPARSVLKQRGGTQEAKQPQTQSAQYSRGTRDWECWSNAWNAPVGNFSCNFRGSGRCWHPAGCAAAGRPGHPALAYFRSYSKTEEYRGTYRTCRAQDQH